MTRRVPFRVIGNYDILTGDFHVRFDFLGKGGEHKYVPLVGSPATPFDRLDKSPYAVNGTFGRMELAAALRHAAAEIEGD